MKRRHPVSLIGLVLLVAAVSGLTPAVATPLAELVAMKAEDGELLHGLHYRPQGDSQAVVIHIPGGPGAFYSPQDMAPLASSLNSRGFHFLSVNLRTAGQNGMYYARFEDYPLDISAAVAYAKDQGLDNIILLGHSLSAPRVFYFLSRVREPAVRGVVVSAGITSPYLESQLRWNPAARAEYDAFLAARRKDIEAGRGRLLSSYPWGRNRTFEFSAATWVNVFGKPEESNASTVRFGGDIRLPVLVVHGTDDATAVPENAEMIMASLTNSPRKELAWIEGGNHLFIGTAEKYAAVVSGWLVRNFQSGSARAE